MNLGGWPKGQPSELGFHNRYRLQEITWNNLEKYLATGKMWVDQTRDRE